MVQEVVSPDTKDETLEQLVKQSHQENNLDEIKIIDYKSLVCVDLPSPNQNVILRRFNNPYDFVVQ